MPAIDRDYWLDFAREGISKSIESREKAADRLDTFLLWVWGIYTSIFALASFLNFLSSNLSQLIWVAQPILIIMVSRFTCTMVSMPSTNNDEDILADPNDVASIIDSFQVIVKNKKQKLGIAKTMTIMSIISLSAALIGYNYCDPNNDLRQKLEKEKLSAELRDKSLKESPDLIKAKAEKELLDAEFKNSVRRKMIESLKKGDLKSLDSLKAFN